MRYHLLAESVLYLEISPKDYSGISRWPDVAVDPLGNGMAVWTEIDGSGHYYTRARRYVAASGWAASNRIESSSAYADSARVALDPAGRGVIIWRKDVNQYGHLLASRFVPPNQWSGPSTVRGGTTFGITAPYDVAVLPSGEAIVIWQETVGPNVAFYAAHFK